MKILKHIFSKLGLFAPSPPSIKNTTFTEMSGRILITHNNNVVVDVDLNLYYEITIEIYPNTTDLVGIPKLANYSSNVNKTNPFHKTIFSNNYFQSFYESLSAEEKAQFFNYLLTVKYFYDNPMIRYAAITVLIPAIWEVVIPTIQALFNLFYNYQETINEKINIDFIFFNFLL